MAYVELPLTTNAEAMVEEIYASMEEQFSGWTPAAGNFEAALIRSQVYVLTQPLAQLTSDVADEVFHRYGEEIAAVAPHEPTVATVDSKWTMVDTSGYTIPAGTQVDIERTGSEQIAFRTAAEFEVAPGATVATGIVLEAIEPGTYGNGLTGAATLVDALGEVDAVELEGTTAGGEDAEEPAAYLTRLAETMQTFANRPIIARDVAILARGISGVARAAVIDNYNATTETGELEKTTSLALLAADGSNVSAAVEEAVEAELEEKREVNYVFIVEKPDRQKIDVKAVIVPLTGYETAAVLAGLKAQLESLLSPAMWGRNDQLDPASWENQTTLRYQDVVTVVNNAQGVSHYTTLEIRKAEGEWVTVDISLTGPFPLVEPGTFTLS